MVIADRIMLKEAMAYAAWLTEPLCFVLTSIKNLCKVYLYFNLFCHNSVNALKFKYKILLFNELKFAKETIFIRRENIQFDLTSSVMNI